MRDEQTVALNRRARHDFTIDETFEAGIVLTGTEIKSIRAGKVNLADAYARIEHGEALAHRRPHRAVRGRQPLQPRAEARPASSSSTAPRSTSSSAGPRPRARRSSRSGSTSIERGRAKVELGLARGKQLHDRRRDIADRDARRDVARELADAQRGR